MKITSISGGTTLNHAFELSARLPSLTKENEVNEPFVLWIFGLPSAGKSTLAVEIQARMRVEGRPALLLDGDELRKGLCSGLGFSDSDRTENLRRAAEVAKIGLVSGISSVVAMITPFTAQREFIKSLLAGVRVIWVWADCPLDVCRSRDVKGLYRRQSAGVINNLTGADGAFNPPLNDVLRIDTGSYEMPACADIIWKEITGYSDK